MWISRRTDYATRAVLVLAMDPDSGPVTIDAIASRCDAPKSVLEQVLPVLRTAGIVRSERGRHGGYQLNKPSAEITMERVVRLFEGPLAPIACATRRNPEPCSMTVGCSLRAVWHDVRDLTIQRLRQTTFADLADQAGGVWLPDPATRM